MKHGFLTALALIAGVSFTAAAAEVDEPALKSMVLQNCGACHGMTLEGGLGPALTQSALAGKDQAALVKTILDGSPGTAMPPWGTQLSQADAEWIVKQLVEGTLK